MHQDDARWRQLQAATNKPDQFLRRWLAGPRLFQVASKKVCLLFPGQSPWNLDAPRRGRRVGFLAGCWRRPSVGNSRIGRNRFRADSKAGAKATDQVRVKGSVLLVFDRACLVKLDQLRGDAGGFRVQVDIGSATWRSCVLSARIWPPAMPDWPKPQNKKDCAFGIVKRAQSRRRPVQNPLSWQRIGSAPTLQRRGSGRIRRWD